MSLFRIIWIVAALAVLAAVPLARAGSAVESVLGHQGPGDDDDDDSGDGDDGDDGSDESGDVDDGLDLEEGGDDGVDGNADDSPEDDAADASEDAADGDNWSNGSDDDRRTASRESNSRQLAAASDDELDFELDDYGYEVTPGEILAAATETFDASEVATLGLTVASREQLPGLGMDLVTLKVPVGADANTAYRKIVGRTTAMVARNHYLTAGQTQKSRRKAGPIRRHRAPKGVVGIIDGGISTGAGPGGISLVTASFSRRSSAASGHGTAVASVLANAGVKKIYSANIFEGRKATTSKLLKALDWMATNKVPVINVSLAGPPNPIVRKAIAILVSRGHIVVAAVGNNGPAAPPLYPAAYPEVVAVTAVDSKGTIYKRANRGRHTLFAAPGVGITVSNANGSTRVLSGTSFAAPVVSAQLARRLDYADPNLRRKALEAVIRSARDLGAPGRDPVFGVGLITPGS